MSAMNCVSNHLFLFYYCVLHSLLRRKVVPLPISPSGSDREGAPSEIGVRDERNRPAVGRAAAAAAWH